jgi:hypothetical protein
VLVRLERRYRHRNCSIQFERLWVEGGKPPRPALVESAAFTFQREAGAVAGFEAARALIAHTAAVPRESLHGRSSTPPRRCGRRAPDRYLAHVFLDGVVVSVNVPLCFCVEPEEPDHDAYTRRRE